MNDFSAHAATPVTLKSGVFFDDPEGDADLATLSDYLAGELDADGRTAVERRLETDPAFADMALPLVELWRAARTDAQRQRTRGVRRWTYAIAAAVLAASAVAMKMTPNTSQAASTASMWRPETYAAGDSVRAVIVSGGVLVTLAPHASATVDRLRFGDMAVDIALAGNAWLDVPRRASAHVRTAVGTLDVGAGRFTVTDSIGTNGAHNVHISREEPNR